MLLTINPFEVTMNAYLRKTAAIVLSLGLITPPAFAQDFDKEMERPDQAAETQKQLIETAETAEKAAAAKQSPGVAYEDILKDPDNIELNYKYALTQVAEGNLRQAAATLERILMVDAALPKVRLTYAIVLYRLDNYPEAQRELEALNKLPMPQSLKDEIEEYLDRIKRSRRKTNVLGSLGFGWQYDSNRNSAPRTGQRLFAGSPVDLTTGLKTDDPSYIFRANVGLTRDLGFQEGHNLFFNTSYYRAEQIKVNNLDFQAYNWDFGGTIKSSKYGNFTPKAKFGYISLEQNTYLRTRGMDFNWERPINNRWTLFTGIDIMMMEFVNGPAIVNADDRTGFNTTFRLGSHILLNPKNRLTLAYAHTKKDARQLYNAYRRDSYQASHALLVGKGMFLLSQLTVNKDVYREVETAIHPTLRRKDVTTRLGFTYGVPLKLVWRPLKDLLWTTGFEFYDSVANMVNYEYQNKRVSMNVTYRFDY